MTPKSLIVSIGCLLGVPFIAASLDSFWDPQQSASSSNANPAVASNIQSNQNFSNNNNNNFGNSNNDSLNDDIIKNDPLVSNSGNSFVGGMPSSNFGMQQPRLCQVIRQIQPVQYVSYSDQQGKWALYTQIMVTRNVGNRCDVNEYVYLAQRQPSGWFWNPKKTSILYLAQEEPKFVTRTVRDPRNPARPVNVNMSRAREEKSTDLRSAFTEHVAHLVLNSNINDTKWLETARQLSSRMNQSNLYFQLVKAHRNSLDLPLHYLPRPGSQASVYESIRE